MMFILSCILSVLKSSYCCVSQHLRTSQPHLELSQSRKETRLCCSVMWTETNQLMWCGCREGNWNSLQHPTTGDDFCQLLLPDIAHNATCTLFVTRSCTLWHVRFWQLCCHRLSLLECYAMLTVNFRVNLSETRCCTRREVRMTGINSQWQWWCNDEVAGRFATQTGGWWGWGVECWAVWWQGRCVERCVIYQHCHMTKFCNKCKFVPVHNMKAYRITRSIAPLTLNLGMRCKWVLHFMRWLLLPPVKGPLISTE